MWAPRQPDSFSVVSYSARVVVVNITAPSCTNGAIISSYTVQGAAFGGQWLTLNTQLREGLNNVNVLAVTNYTLRVFAVSNEGGHMSAIFSRIVRLLSHPLILLFSLSVWLRKKGKNSLCTLA